MPRLFQVFALAAGLYGCQVWATSSLTYDPQKSPPHMSFILASWKDSWVSRKVLLTACSAKQVRFPFYSIALVQMHDTNLEQLLSDNPLLEKVVRADLLIANRSDTCTNQVLHALPGFPASPQFLNAIRSLESIHLKQFELTSSMSSGAGESLTI